MLKLSKLIISYCHTARALILYMKINFALWGLKWAFISETVQEMFCEKRVLKNFTKFTRKLLRRSLNLIKLHARGLQLY